MSASIMMLGTAVNLARTTWQGAPPATLPFLVVVLAPVISAAPIPCLLVETDAGSTRLQALVPPGTVFPIGTEVQLLDSRLEAICEGVVG